MARLKQLSRDEHARLGVLLQTLHDTLREATVLAFPALGAKHCDAVMRAERQLNSHLRSHLLFAWEDQFGVMEGNPYRLKETGRWATTGACSLTASR